MSFSVSLPQDYVKVEPGLPLPVSLNIQNTGAEIDQFEAIVEGVDPDWTHFPEPSVVVAAGESHTARVLFRIPRESESAAGTYPFVLKVRSLTSGDARSVQGVIEVLEFHQIGVMVEPQRNVAASMNPVAEYQVQVMNLGNTAHEVQLFATDPESAVRVEFESTIVHLAPGQQRSLTMVAETGQKKWIAKNKTYTLGISARSSNDSTVAAFTNCQLEIGPSVSVGTAVTVGGLTLLAIAWALAIPKPPRIDEFSIDPKAVTLGTPVQISYRIERANSAKLMAKSGPEGEEIVLLVTKDDAGSLSFDPPAAGEYTITLEAKSGDKVVRKSGTIIVNPPVKAPKPEIKNFKLSRTTVESGDSIRVNYSLSDGVTKATLLPVNIILDPRQESIEFIPSWLNTQEVRIVAENADGEKTERAIRVTVNKKEIVIPPALVQSFSVNPPEVKPDDKIVRVTWVLKDAVRAEIVFEGLTTPADPLNGFLELPVTKGGDLVLRAYNSAGKVTERRAKVKIAETLPDGPADPASPGGTTPNPDPAVIPSPNPNPNATTPNR